MALRETNYTDANISTKWDWSTLLGAKGTLLDGYYPP